LDYIGIDNNFMNGAPIAQQLRESTDKWDHMKLKSFWTAKETVTTRLKTAHRTEENLCQLYTWQSFNNQNIQGAQKTNLSKNKPTE
jgi:hypothetical protein